MNPANLTRCDLGPKKRNTWFFPMVFFPPNILPRTIFHSTRKNGCCKSSLFFWGHKLTAVLFFLTHEGVPVIFSRWKSITSRFQVKFVEGPVAMEKTSQCHGSPPRKICPPEKRPEKFPWKHLILAILQLALRPIPLPFRTRNQTF